MVTPLDPLEFSQARRYLDEVNQYLLNGAGEILETPGKLNLVWNDPVYDVQRYLAVKSAGDTELLINGRRYPATEADIKRAIKACLVEMQVIKS